MYRKDGKCLCNAQVALATFKGAGSKHACALRGTARGGGHFNGVYVFGTAYWTDADVPWAAAFGQLHAPLSWFLSALVTGHIIMAGYHRLIRRDDTHTGCLGARRRGRIPLWILRYAGWE
ncbi:cytochrome b/b6 domain-containing protein [Chromohalobacter canadensis]|uniref:cytochrome b/b6 domain-containing protein n=1 Tax=Chromohalobacter canadensis TaxID=141389 RepID=UPI003D69E88B